MDNFDLKQFLIENKLTENSKVNEAWTKERREQDPEGYAKYLEKAKQAQKQYYEKNREKAKQYYEKNREKNREYAKQSAKQYYEKNPEKVKQRTNQYNKQHREKLKQAAKQYKEKNLEKLKQAANQYAKQHRKKLKQDPEAYAKYLEKANQYNKQHREKLKQDPEVYAKYLDYQKQYAKQNKEKYDSYVKQSSDFFYNTITNNPSPELKNIKDNPKLLTKLYSEFIKKAKQQYKSKNKDFSFMVTENSKLNEIKATPKNTGVGKQRFSLEKWENLGEDFEYDSDDDIYIYYGILFFNDPELKELSSEIQYNDYTEEEWETIEEKIETLIEILNKNNIEWSQRTTSNWINFTIYY
jgi:hypothetical protein